MSKYKFLLILGSPPHTWRILTTQRKSCILARITSTYVENTKYCLSSHGLEQDHLHIRGEYTKRSLIIEPFLIL